MLAPRLREWLLRYAPAEALSLLATLAAAMVASRAGHSAVGVALAGTWSGNLAYFGLILAQDMYQTQRQLHREGRHYSWRTWGRNLRALVVEFGPAEAFDSLLIRPALMLWFPRWLGSLPRGILLAKFAADVTFYLPAIVSYEWSKRRFRRF